MECIRLESNSNKESTSSANIDPKELKEQETQRIEDIILHYLLLDWGVLKQTDPKILFYDHTSSNPKSYTNLAMALLKAKVIRKRDLVAERWLSEVEKPVRQDIISVNLHEKAVTRMVREDRLDLDANLLGLECSYRINVQDIWKEFSTEENNFKRFCQSNFNISIEIENVQRTFRLLSYLIGGSHVKALRYLIYSGCMDDQSVYEQVSFLLKLTKRYLNIENINPEPFKKFKHGLESTQSKESNILQQPSRGLLTTLPGMNCFASCLPASRKSKQTGESSPLLTNDPTRKVELEEMSTSSQASDHLSDQIPDDWLTLHAKKLAFFLILSRHHAYYDIVHYLIQLLVIKHQEQGSSKFQFNQQILEDILAIIQVFYRRYERSFSMGNSSQNSRSGFRGWLRLASSHCFRESSGRSKREEFCLSYEWIHGKMGQPYYISDLLAAKRSFSTYYVREIIDQDLFNASTAHLSNNNSDVPPGLQKTCEKLRTFFHRNGNTNVDQEGLGWVSFYILGSYYAIPSGFTEDPRSLYLRELYRKLTANGKLYLPQHPDQSPDEFKEVSLRGNSSGTKDDLSVIIQQLLAYSITVQEPPSLLSVGFFKPSNGSKPSSDVAEACFGAIDALASGQLKDFYKVCGEVLGKNEWPDRLKKILDLALERRINALPNYVQGLKKPSLFKRIASRVLAEKSSFIPGTFFVEQSKASISRLNRCLLVLYEMKEQDQSAAELLYGFLLFECNRLRTPTAKNISFYKTRYRDLLRIYDDLMDEFGDQIIRLREGEILGDGIKRVREAYGNFSLNEDSLLRGVYDEQIQLGKLQ